MGVVPYELPVQTPVRVQSEATAVALVSGVGRAGSIAKSERLINSRRAATEKSTASNAEKAAIPIRCRYADPDPHFVSNGWMCRDDRHAANAWIPRIDGSRLNCRVR